MESEANGPQFGTERELDTGCATSTEQGGSPGLGEDALGAEEPSYAGDRMSAWPPRPVGGICLDQGSAAQTQRQRR